MMEYNFPMYLSVPSKQRMFQILNYIGDGIEYVDGKGYVKLSEGIVYIFSDGNVSTKHDGIPYFWKDNSGLKFTNVSPYVKKLFDSSKLVEYNFDVMVENINEDEELYNEAALNDMNAATSLFKPAIKDTDDFLKRIIKQAILDKDIDIKRLQHKMEKKYGLTNMKSALIGETKMSVVNFVIWCELLGLNWEITLCDNGIDKINPLKKPIVFSSVLGGLRKEK